MFVKQAPVDFVVREITEFPFSPSESKARRYSFYQLDKTGLGTPEVASVILSKWNLQRQQLSYGGLKDRHASTRQFLTIDNGPATDLAEPGFTLKFLGFSNRKFTAADILRNQFEIQLRGLTAEAAHKLALTLERLPGGVPNYFDDQRFGSLGDSGQFIAHPWCLGDYEKAFYLAVAEHNPHDRPRDREQKRIVREHWGDWTTCKALLERSHLRSLVTYLVDHPQGFKRAVGLIRQDLRSIYVAAFQAKLWNETVARWLSSQLLPEQYVAMYGASGRLVVPYSLSADWHSRLSELSVPLPSGRKTDWDPEILLVLDQVLAEFSLERHRLRFSYPRDVFFSRGSRPVMLLPEDLTTRVETEASDESDDKGHVVRLKFQLRAGQYATMLIKTATMLAVDQE